MYLKALLLNIVCVLVVESRHHPIPPWDHLVFTQEWPPSACIAAEGHHHCVVPKDVQTWTIHGLWPSLGDTRGPGYCNNSWHFRESEIKTLEPKMNLFWPNLFVDTPLVDLWKHEWTKHGTCAAAEPALRGEANYFNKTLLLRQKYAMEELLDVSSIKPNEKLGYKAANVIDALQTVLRKNVTVQCIHSKKYNTDSSIQLLSQIEICLDRHSLLPIDCLSSTNCQKDKPIFYPTLKNW